MTETRIFLALGQAAGLLWHHDHDRRSVSKCATCACKRAAFGIARDTGFCGDCLDRSRVREDDDIGGES